MPWDLLGFLQLLSPLDGIGLVLGSPLGHLGIGFGQVPLELALGLYLLLVLLPQQVTVVPGGLQGMGQGVLALRKGEQQLTPGSRTQAMAPGLGAAAGSFCSSQVKSCPVCRVWPTSPAQELGPLPQCHSETSHAPKPHLGLFLQLPLEFLNVLCERDLATAQLVDEGLLLLQQPTKLPWVQTEPNQLL